MSNRRYVFQLGGHFRFVKLFDQLLDAIEYTKLRIEPKDWDREQENNSWGHDDILVSVTDELRRSLNAPSSKPFKNLKSTKLLFRPIAVPRFAVYEKGIDHVKKITSEKTLEEFTAGFGFSNEIGVWWEVKIEVSLCYVELLDEVKIEGQPYQPAREQQGQTEWFPVYKMARGEYNSRLSIDPTPRKICPYGSNGEVEMAPTEYWHVLSNSSIKLTTTED